MDKNIKIKLEKQSIYEIYKACRLCGGGGGFKMPIIQDVVDISETEIKDKIRECLQIEVSQDDKMPPLICELCIDKLNDFYEFLEMCRQTNINTRLKLGLPIHTSQTSEDCILGDTDPVIIKKEPELSSSINIKSSKSKKNNNKKERKKTEDKKGEIKLKIKLSKNELPKVSSPSLSKQKSCDSTPKEVTPRLTRASRSSDDEVLSKISESKSSRPMLSKMDRALIDNVDPSLLPKTLKRNRDTSKQEPPKVEVPLKKVKFDVKPSTKSPKSKPTHKETKASPQKSSKVTFKDLLRTSPRDLNKASIEEPKPVQKSPVPTKGALKALPRESKVVIKTESDIPKSEPKSNLKINKNRNNARAGPKSSKRPTKVVKEERDNSPPPLFTCSICKLKIKTSGALAGHLQSQHLVLYTCARMACNACELWFQSTEEANEHHREHKANKQPYHCQTCSTDFITLDNYNEHFGKRQCIPMMEVPDFKCQDCWFKYPTRPLLDKHVCAGVEGRRGGKCSKCKNFYHLHKNLKLHEGMCTYRKRGELVIDPAIKSRLRPIQVRLAKCDSLVRNRKGPYDVSNVPPHFGYDLSCVYPYVSSFNSTLIRMEPVLNFYDRMVCIGDDITSEFSRENFTHWDSNSDVSDEGNNSDTVLSTNSNKNVDSLANLTLRILFSRKYIGKVPRKRKKMQLDNSLFDSVANSSEIDIGLSRNIENIINDLDDDSVDLNNCESVDMKNVESKRNSIDYKIDSTINSNEPIKEEEAGRRNADSSDLIKTSNINDELISKGADVPNTSEIDELSNIDNMVSNNHSETNESLGTVDDQIVDSSVNESKVLSKSADFERLIEPEKTVLNGVNKNNGIDEELENQKLLDALDAQIGENIDKR